MKKTVQFNVGDKVFAKVKGYPPWPAKIISESGKKYKVEFYGTGETGNIKGEDLSYYLKNKDKHYKPQKRKDYENAFEQIEEAIKKDGGDGDSSPDIEDSNVSLNSTIASIDTPVKGKKTVKRKRSLSEKTSPEVPPTPKKMGRTRKTTDTNDDPTNVKIEEIEVTPPKINIATKKSPRVKKEEVEEENENIEKKEKVIDKKEKGESKIEKVGVKKEKLTDKSLDVTNDKSGKIKDQKLEDKAITNLEEMITLKEKEAADKTDDIDDKIEVVSDKFLSNNIAYAKYVKESESYYKDKPVEPRDDFPNQVLAVKLPTSDDLGGLKLHQKWPLKFANEYDRALYDETVAVRVLDAKLKVASGDQTIINDPDSFIKNINMTADTVKKVIYLKDLEMKKARIARLKTEAELTGLDAKIKGCLGLDKADPKEALGYLEAMSQIEFDEIMLKKHTHIIEMVRRLRKYVGNTEEWNMSEESLNEFSSWAEKVRAKAENVYSKFKEVMKLPENCTSFWDGFMESVNKFRADCENLSETQIYVLCAEPRTRRAFLDRLDDMESEKDSSNGDANSEPQSTAVNGTTDTTT